MLEKIIKNMLETAGCGCTAGDIKTVTETPISNNTDRGSQPIDLDQQEVNKAVNAIRSQAKTEYSNLSAAFKAYVNYNKLPADMRDRVFVALFGD